MADTRDTKGRAPVMKAGERFISLSPTNEALSGPQYNWNPAAAGELPADPLDLTEGHGEEKE